MRAIIQFILLAVWLIMAVLSYISAFPDHENRIIRKIARACHIGRFNWPIVIFALMFMFFIPLWEY